MFQGSYHLREAEKQSLSMHFTHFIFLPSCIFGS